MKQIPLTQNKFALVDDEDYQELSLFKWCAVRRRTTWYAVRGGSRDESGKQKSFLMHRAILGLKKGDKLESDHRDHNGLNNRRSNLRLCTHSQNCMNRKLQKDVTSKYKGVCWNKKRNKWTAEIRKDGKKHYLGCFDSEIEAAKVYDKRATELFGEFAYLNFPEIQNPKVSDSKRF